MVTENLSQGLGATVILSSFGADNDSKMLVNLQIISVLSALFPVLFTLPP